VVFCSWDGEEVGLTGSTEWGEQFADDLRKKAVALHQCRFLNFWSELSRPGSGVTSPHARRNSSHAAGSFGQNALRGMRVSTARERREAKQAEEVTDSNLADTRIGSGSDHTVFLNFVGMPVIGLQFDGPYGVYHSAYDDFFLDEPFWRSRLIAITL